MASQDAELNNRKEKMTQCAKCGAPCGTKYKNGSHGGYLCEKCNDNAGQVGFLVLMVGVGICAVVGSIIAGPILLAMRPLVNLVGYNAASIIVLLLGVALIAIGFILWFVRKRKHGCLIRFIYMIIIFGMFCAGLVMTYAYFEKGGKILHEVWDVKMNAAQQDEPLQTETKQQESGENK